MLNGIQPSSKVFAGIKGLTSRCDATIANLEIPLTNSKTRTSRKSEADLKAKNQWILKADPRHAPILAQAGFSMVSLANNHAMDYGANGLAEMTSLLDLNRICHAGAATTANLANAPTFLTLPNRKRIGMLSALAFMTPQALRKTTPATLTSAGVAVLSLGGAITKFTREKLTRWVQSARAGSDFVVVALHWGVERKPLPTAYQVSLGRALIDAGADIVWGNHPHVLQGAELYKGHLIMYSMGNLISPTPAKGGFFKVHISDDGTQAVEFYPSVVKEHRVSFTGGRGSFKAVLDMHALCKLLLQRYPSTVSVPAL